MFVLSMYPLFTIWSYDNKIYSTIYMYLRPCINVYWWYITYYFYYHLNPMHCTVRGFFLQETQMSHLEKAGFSEEDITTELVPMDPPKECKYYQFKQMIAPTVIKQKWTLSRHKYYYVAGKRHHVFIYIENWKQKRKDCVVCWKYVVYNI